MADARAGMTDGATRWLAGAVMGLCLIYALGSVTTYPVLFPDPAYTLLVAKSRAPGVPWNHVSEPAAADISRDSLRFYATSSPGDYVVPGVFITLGLTLGDALRLVNILAALLALVGWGVLCRSLGLSIPATVTTIAIVAVSRTFAFSFLSYLGGDQLAFAGFPYLAWIVWRWRERWLLVPSVPIVLVAAFFLKNSLMISMSLWTAAAVAAPLLAGRRSLRQFSLAAAIAIAGVGTVLLVHHFFIARGWTPVSYEPSWSTDGSRYLLPLVMPMLAPTGIDDVLSRLFDNPSLPKLDYKHSVLFLLGLSVIYGGWVRRELSSGHRTAAAIQILLFVTGFSAVFIVLLASRSAVSADLSRHYMIPGTLLLPLFVEGWRRARSPVLRRTAVALIAVTGTYGMLSFASNWLRHYRATGSHSDAVRVLQPTIPARDIRALGRLDADLPPGSLVVLPIPSLAFEFRRTRVAATSSTSDSVHDIQQREWRGRVANLVIVVEDAGQTGEEITAWLSSFADYDPGGWQRIAGDGVSFFVPAGQPVDAAWIAARLRDDPTG